MAFYPRLSRYSSGSISGDITGLDWYKFNYPYNAFAIGLPNCTTYAYGRSMEIAIQNGKDWYSVQHYNNPLWWNGQSTFGNAENWFSAAVNAGIWETGSTPKLGAIACWDGSNYGRGGHVAIVEKISGSTVTLSNSDYGGSIFYIRTASPVVGEVTSYVGEKFLGYIYNPFVGTSQGNTLIYRRGDYVKILSPGRSQADGGGRTSYGIGYTRRIYKIYPGKEYPYRVGFMSGITTGFYKANALKLIRRK